MAMKKADLAAHTSRYDALVGKARTAEQRGLYREAVRHCLDAWEHIDGMMQYGRRYDSREFSSIAAIDMILRYASFLLDYESLDELEALLKECRRIERNTSQSMSDKLAAARERMWENHRLWDHLERNPGFRQDQLRQSLGGDQDRWRAVAEAWERMGLLHREPAGGSYRLALSTRMGQLVSAKCPSCGSVADGPKAMFLEDTRCPDCGCKGFFVLLHSNDAHTEED